jgi:hypothetical protein
VSVTCYKNSTFQTDQVATHLEIHSHQQPQISYSALQGRNFISVIQTLNFLPSWKHTDLIPIQHPSCEEGLPTGLQRTLWLKRTEESFSLLFSLLRFQMLLKY